MLSNKDARSKCLDAFKNEKSKSFNRTKRLGKVLLNTKSKRLVKAAKSFTFVFEYVKNGQELRDRQQILNLLGQIQEL